MAAEATIGVTGLAVMGANLARNIARRGITVAVHNRTNAKTDEFVQEYGSEGTFVAARDVRGFVASIKRPRAILMMVKAGKPVDDVIAELLPHLDPGDILIDGGNSYFADTRRRTQEIEAKGFRYIGTGVSGGEEGALLGPSIMPGGTEEAYRLIEPVLTQIAAQVDGRPCCTYIGADGAGHYVKMVHNGIEYADMQLIAEAYDLLKGVGLSATEAADVFAQWNTGDLDSYLIEITSEVLRQVDAKTGKPLVDVIVDAAGMKGKGTWTVQEALRLGVPTDAISEAVFARAVSSSPELRKAGQAALSGPSGISGGEKDALIEDIRQALWSAKVVAYAQGLHLIKAGATEYGWNIDVAACALSLIHISEP